MTYSEALEWLYSTQLFGIKLGLDNPRRLLREYLAHPSRTTRVIHVAGTNGKGSTCAFIDSVARATGTRTGLFTSPHLVRYNERVRVSGMEIPDDDVARHLGELRLIAESWETHPTFFEISLALAMRHFAERGCEVIVLETGMGGRLDATTAVPADVAVLTSIALDHQQWLGESLVEIAAEKAGIIVPKKPVIVTPQAPEVHDFIAQEANEKQAPVEFISDPLRGYSLGLPGEHQCYNAAAALSALHAVGIHLGYETVKAGLAKVSHPGRFEVVDPPWPTPIPGPDAGVPLVMDIAHNPSAAAALVSTWRERFGTRKATLVFGAVESKDAEGMLAGLLPLASTIRLVPVNSPRAVPPEELLGLLPDRQRKETRTHSTLAGALQAASDSPEPVLLTGSAFLVGEARALLEGSVHAPSAQ